MKASIIFILSLTLCACAASRQSGKTVDIPADVREAIGNKHYAVTFTYPTPNNRGGWERERWMGYMRGDTLKVFPCHDLNPDAGCILFRVENYREKTAGTGAVEVTFDAREIIPGMENPVANPWKLVILAPDKVEITGLGMEFPFKGAIRLPRENGTSPADNSPGKKKK